MQKVISTGAVRTISPLDFLQNFYIPQHVGINLEALDQIRQTTGAALANAGKLDTDGKLLPNSIASINQYMAAGRANWRSNHLALLIDCGGTFTKSFAVFQGPEGKPAGREIFKFPSRWIADLLPSQAPTQDSLEGFTPYFKYFVEQVSENLRKAGLLQPEIDYSFGLIWSNLASATPMPKGVDLIAGDKYRKGELYRTGISEGESLIGKFEALFREQIPEISFKKLIGTNDTTALVPGSTIGVVNSTGFNIAREIGGVIENTEAGQFLRFPISIFKDPTVGFSEKVKMAGQIDLQDLVAYSEDRLPLQISEHLASFFNSLPEDQQESLTGLLQVIPQINAKTLVLLLAGNSEKAKKEFENSLRPLPGTTEVLLSDVEVEICRQVARQVFDDSLKILATVLAEFVNPQSKILIDSHVAYKVDGYVEKFSLALFQALRAGGKEISWDIVNQMVSLPPVDELYQESGISAPARGLAEALNYLVASQD